ncbi:MAG: hypothetical protein H6831_14810 [Planctomycetes bacterium]|nr:hypothetical protein [Planctomycetota bacterium]MCB9905671.1 hypothetical protein [Planctomycetota bacterium]
MRRLWLLVPFLVLVTLLALRGGGRSGDDPLTSPAATREPRRDVGVLPPPAVRTPDAEPAAAREAVESTEPATSAVTKDPDPDEPPEEAEDVELYPDPVELGDCALFLEVYERSALLPVATTVHLWRLDAPGNEHWGAGAQLQATIDVGLEGGWARELPAGRYRARCLAERRANEDPHEFMVSGDTTRLRLSIDTPRERELLVQLFSADGEPIREAEFSLQVRGANSHSVGRPDWAKEREPKFDAAFVGVGMGGAWSGGRRARWKRLSADAEGWFRPGSAREGKRDETPTYRLEARVGELAPLSHYFDGDDEDLRWISVLVDPELAERSVVAPDGRSCAELSRGLRVTSGVLPFRPGQADSWRHVPVEASRRWEDDYEDFELSFTLADLPLPTRELIEKPARR